MSGRRSRVSIAGVVRTGVMVLLSGLAILWVWSAGDWASARTALSTARWGLLVPSVAAILMTHVVRAARWGVLLRPVREAVSYRARLDATFVGFALNNVLPARAGEIARGLWLGRREDVSVTAALTTIGLGRVFDLAAVLLSLAAGLQLAASGGMDSATAQTLQHALTRGVLLLALAAVVLAGLVAFRHRLSVRLRRLLSGRYLDRARGVARSVLGSLETLRSPGAVAAAAGWTLALWAFNAIAFAMVLSAFDVAAPVGLVLVTQSVVALAVALPQAPGGIGVFEASVMAVLLGLGGASPGPALAATIVLHGVVLLPPVVAGAAVMLASTRGWLDRLGVAMGRRSSGARQPRYEAPVSRP